jgi:CRP-like cAMP-binding protein
MLTNFCIIASTVRGWLAVVTRRAERAIGEVAELERLAPGDFLGEGGLLMGAGELGTVTALISALVYEQSSRPSFSPSKPSLLNEVD